MDGRFYINTCNCKVNWRFSMKRHFICRPSSTSSALFLGYLYPALVVNFPVPTAEYGLLYPSVCRFPEKPLLHCRCASLAIRMHPHSFHFEFLAELLVFSENGLPPFLIIGLLNLQSIFSGEVQI